MIVDSVINITRYIPEASVSKVQGFMAKVNPSMPEGYHPIDGDNIYARVMSYNTSARKDCKIEAHNEYVDVQSTLIGSEGIEIFDRSALNVEAAYDKEQDVEFFEETIPSYLFVDNQPGRFSMIFPEEAHRPQISVNGKNEVVKKFVIKIRKDLF